MKSVLLAIDWSLVRVGLVILGMGVFTVIMETVVMVLFKFDSFGKSLVYSIMANIGSLLLGILLFRELQFFIPALLGAYTLYVLLRKYFLILTVRYKWKQGLTAAFLMLLSFLIFLSILQNPVVW